MSTFVKKRLPALLLALSAVGSSTVVHAQSYPYIGEVKLFAGNYAPDGWAFADGRILSISEYNSLFNLIGTTYGGDGQETFALPDLRGRVPVHQGTLGSETVVVGEAMGASYLPVYSNNMPSGQSRGDFVTLGSTTVSGAVPVAPERAARTVERQTPNVGGGGGIPNRPPYLGLNYIISLTGVYPTQ